MDETDLYMCDYCDSIFKGRKIHEKDYSPINPNEEYELSFCSLECYRDFNRSQNAIYKIINEGLDESFR